ncbi:hypothetical protein AX16_008750 [Volvariella volvacea WC 439]|nr:hypothetical protein AX16_008750 [Volvariella volvacea WC 439]
MSNQSSANGLNEQTISIALAALKDDIPSSEPPSAEFLQMVSGQPYFASDPFVRKVATLQRSKLRAIQNEDDDQKRMELARRFFTLSKPDAQIYVILPFFCEYGFNITVGDDVLFNAGCTILDVCPVTIGSRTMFGPNVQIYTAEHPLKPEDRNGLRGREWARPIVIGDDCWIGGSAILLPGITIGSGSTVGAGSVVTKDVPPRSVVVGNPARVVRTIDP